MKFSIKPSKDWYYISLLGKYSYGAYLIHPIIIENIAKWVVPNLSWLTPPFIMAIILIGCVIFSFIIAVLISKIPFGNWLIGTVRHKKVYSK